MQSTSNTGPYTMISALRASLFAQGRPATTKTVIGNIHIETSYAYTIHDALEIESLAMMAILLSSWMVTVRVIVVCLGMPASG